MHARMQHRDTPLTLAIRLGRTEMANRLLGIAKEDPLRVDVNKEVVKLDVNKDVISGVGRYTY